VSDHTTYDADCACRQSPPVHEDDSYGDCIICREWVPHTDDDHVKVRFPCAVVRADKAEAALAAASADAERLAEALGSDEDGYCRECKLMVYEWEHDVPGEPAKAHDWLDRHADDCRIRAALAAHEALEAKP
jgi:hypothetical protein